jgi:hypothetical protein
MFELLGIDYFLGLVPTWVPWAFVVIGILLFVLVQFFQYLIPVMYRFLVVTSIEILSVLIFAFGFYIDGRQDVIINAKNEIEKTVTAQKEITNQVTADLQKSLDDEKKKHEAIIKSIPKIITKADDAKCVVPKSFVGLHNNAAKDTVPNTTTGTNGSATGVELFTGK